MLREHCVHARFVWNLAVEQNSHWHQGRTGAPGYLEQCRQLTAARAEHPWLAAGSQTVQQQALRDFAQARSRETDKRKDWVEKTSTRLAREFDLIRVEDLKVKVMTRSAKGCADKPGRNVRAKAGLNREILRSGWGMLVRRLEDKASGRVEKIQPAYTSQRCSACGHVDRRSRESQARFVCTTCGFACNADVNAAINIAAGHAVSARGGDGAARPVNREPQPLLQSA